MTQPLTNVDVISLATASLAAARSAEDLDVRVFYAATARSAIDQLDEQLKRLRLNLAQVEGELVRRERPAEVKRMGGERT